LSSWDRHRIGAGYRQVPDSGFPVYQQVERRIDETPHTRR